MIVLRWCIRIATGLVALALVAAGGVFIAYSYWERGHLEALERDSRVIDTALGPIEYAPVGQGRPMLYVHGTPGGYDQALIPARVRPESTRSTRYIAVSRPGYLRTPLSSGRTVEEQADLYAALLDELEFDRVIVYGGSGGAPSALQFALRHPERTSALVLVVPLLSRVNTAVNRYERTALQFAMQDIMTWLAASLRPGAFIPGLDTEDPVQLAAVEGLVGSTCRRGCVLRDTRTTGFSSRSSTSTIGHSRR